MWTIFTFTLYIPAYLTEIHGFAAHKVSVITSEIPTLRICELWSIIRINYQHYGCTEMKYFLIMIQMGMLSSLPYVLETLFAILFGYLTDILLRKNILSRTNTRKFAALFSKCNWESPTCRLITIFERDTRLMKIYSWIIFADTIIAGVLFTALAFGGCNSVYILMLLTVAVMLHGASLSGISPNVIDLSPNFCGEFNLHEWLSSTSYKIKLFKLREGEGVIWSA